jgi:hypothetical protein
MVVSRALPRSPRCRRRAAARTIEFDLRREEESNTYAFTCTVRASQCSAIGLGLSRLPTTTPAPSAPAVASPGAPLTVRRTITIKVGVWKPPRRLLMLLSALCWLVSTAGAAAMLAFGAPFLHDALRGSARPLGAASSTARVDRAAVWALTDGGALPSRRARLAGAARAPRVHLAAAAVGASTLFSDVFDPSALAECASIAGHTR